MMFGADIDFARFNQTYWRKQATLLGKVDISGLSDLGFAELVELATEPEVESRQISELDGRYVLDHSVSEPSGNAMVMVQNLESFSYDLSAWLTQHFDFLPRWRIEDVMATLAHQGGNCGPHFDQYDVFLVQLKGEKTWYLDEGGHGSDDLVVDSEIRLLERFKETQTLIQKPGDVLYIPPGVGHHGIASNNCITLSVGIRNPLLNEMASHLADLLLQEEDTGASLSDELAGAAISQQEITQLGDKLTSAMTSGDLLSVWYGSYMTLPRDPELIESEPDFELDISVWRNANNQLSLDLPTRIAFQNGWLFVNGEALALQTPATWLLELQQQRTILTADIPLEDDYLILALIQSGAVLTYTDD